MWAVGAFMALNSDLYDVGLSAWLCERTWVRVLCMPFMRCLIYY